MLHGIGVTDHSVLTRGVIPAYNDIRDKLHSTFPYAKILEPKDIRCDLHSNASFGLVGVPQDIPLPNEKLVIAGFVGMAKDQLVNVNADDIARKLVQLHHKEIEELIFVTKVGGVRKKSGEIVPLLNEKSIGRILKGEDPDIEVSGGMTKKVQEVLKALDVSPKVVMTNTSGLDDEIHQWMGSGTLCVDSRQLATSEIFLREGPIFDAVYQSHVINNKFRERDDDELEVLRMHHRMLRAKKSPLGGFSLVPRDDWVELSALWAGSIGNGIGQMLLHAAKQDAGRRKMYALSSDKDAIDAFIASKLFDDLGPVSKAKNQLPSDAPEDLKNYKKEGRDPHVFIAR